MFRLYLIMALSAAAIGGFFWIRHDAANDRERELRAEAIDRTVNEIRLDKESDDAIDKKSDDDLRNIANGWLRRPTGPE